MTTLIYEITGTLLLTFAAWWAAGPAAAAATLGIALLAAAWNRERP